MRGDNAMYAINGTSYRAIESESELLPGEYAVTEVPAWLHDEYAKADVRARRDNLLRACDWTQMPDVPLDAEARAAWATYRQALRDLPEQPGFPHAVEWPAQPTGDSEA